MDVIISDKIIRVNESNLISSGYTKTGDVYLLNNKYVIKIYRYIIPYYNEYHRTRLDILCKQKLDKFIMPFDIAYDIEGNIVGYTMKYIKGKDGDVIWKLSSKFLIEELEKIYEEVSILSQNNIVLDDLAVCNLIVNESGIYFIDTDDYIIRTKLDYEKNMKDSNFNINTLLKDIFAKSYSYRKNEGVNNMFDSYDIFYKEAVKYYKPNQTVKSLVRTMIRKNRVYLFTPF